MEGKGSRALTVRSPGDGGTVSLGGVLDVRQIEGLLNRLFERVERQDAEMRALRVELEAAKPWKKAYMELQARMLQQSDATDRSLEEVRSRLAGVEAVVPLAKATALEVSDARRVLAQKADGEAVRRMGEETAQVMGESFSKMASGLATAQSHEQLRKSFDGLCKQMSALEGLVSCKVDRSRLPMLDGSLEKVQNFIRGQERHVAAFQDAQKRLEEAAAALKALENKKEDKITMVRRMQQLDKRLKAKLDVKAFEERLAGTLQDVERAAMRGVAKEPTVRTVKEQCSRMDETLRRLSDAFTADQKVSRGTREEFESQIKRIVGSQTRVEADGKEQAKLYATRIQQLEVRAGETGKRQAALVSDLRRQVLEMKQNQNKLYAQLQIAMRFVNWFTDMKLGASAAN